jgi:HEAT repeat protein
MGFDYWAKVLFWDKGRQKGADWVKKLILMMACFFLFQNISLADESESKSARLQKKELPRTFLAKSKGNVVISKKGESVSLSSTGSTLEEVLQGIAEDGKVVLIFYCKDPSLNQETRANLKISADSLVKLLQQLLPEDCRFSPLNRDGKETENSKDMAALHIYPKGCTGSDRPVRVFVPERNQRLQAKRLKEISLEELNDALKTQGPSSRRRASMLLGMKGDEKGIPYAREALKDPNPEVMFAAANGLKSLGVKFGHEKVSDAIYERFFERPYAEFLPIMAQVDKDRFFEVIEGFMDQGGETEQAFMIRALSLTKDRKAVQYLSRFASAGGMENSRQAIYAMGKIGGPEAAGTLMKVLRGEDAERQAMAVQTISLMPQSEGADLRAEVEKMVKEGRVSDQALQALAAGSYLEPLEKLMKDPASKPELKVRTLKAMAGRESEKAIKVMGMGLNDEASQVRLASVEAMGESVSNAAIPYLIKATEDKEAKIKVAAVRWLGEFPGDSQAGKALGKAIYDQDESVRRKAAESLSMLGKPSQEVIEVLKDCEKNHKDPFVANMAGSILREWKVK